MYERIIIAFVITILVLIIIHYSEEYVVHHTLSLVLALGIGVSLSDWLLRVYKKDLNGKTTPDH